MKYYSPKWAGHLAMIISVIVAFSYPIMGIFFTKLLFVSMAYMKPTFNEDRDFWCGLYLLLAFGVGIFGFLQKYLFAFTGENLTYTVRKLLWEGIIYKHISWFDNRERAPGVLTNILSEDITQLNGLTSETISHIIEAALGLIIGIILSFIFSWEMAFITLALSPFVLSGSVLMAKLQWKVKNKASAKAGDIDYYTESNALLSDIIMNYRTVISFGAKNIDFLMEKYDSLLVQPNKQAVKNSHISGVLFGYSLFTRFAFIGAVFYFGTLMIIDHGLDPEQTYIAIQILFLSAVGAGMSISHAPSMGKARDSATTVFAIIDEPSQIDVRDTTGIKKVEKGEIELK